MGAVVAEVLARGSRVAGMLILPPLFLLLTAIPWLLVAHAAVLAAWLWTTGWRPLGVLAGALAVTLGLALLVTTVVFFVAWLVELARVALGRPSDDGT